MDYRISCSGYTKVTIGKIYVSSESTYGSSLSVYKDSTLLKTYNAGTYSNQTLTITGASTLRFTGTVRYYASSASGYFQTITISA